MSRIIVLTVLLAFVTQAVLALTASGAEVTRAEYVEQAEPICKANTLVSQKILRGIQNDIRERRLKLADEKFSRAARALARTINQLEGIPQPTADEVRLKRWFTHLEGEVELLERITGRLRAGTTAKVGEIILELRHNTNVTNNIVLTFGFEYCLIQPARYI